MAQGQLVSLERVLASLYRDIKPIGQELSENDLVEWCGEALEQIGAYSQYEEKVEYITVSDYKALIPCGMHQIVQIAYKHTPGGDTSCDCAIKITNSDGTSACTSSSCSGNCGSTDVCEDVTQSEDAIVTQARQLIDYHLQYRFTKTRAYHNNFRPMSLASGNYSKAKTAHCDNCINLSATCSEEYAVDHPYIRTSFKSGSICLAYIRQPLDERGWPMIPDNVSYTEAMKRYLVYKLKYSEFLTGKIHPNVYMKLEDDWHWYCAQARGKMNMPDTIDKMQNLLNQRKRLIPNENRYYGFFGNLNTPEKLALGGKYN